MIHNISTHLRLKLRLRKAIYLNLMVLKLYQDLKIRLKSRPSRMKVSLFGLLDYLSPYFHLKLPLDLPTLGDHQILLDHKKKLEDFGTITCLDHQGPHSHLKIILDCQSPYFHLTFPIGYDDCDKLLHILSQLKWSLL